MAGTMYYYAMISESTKVCVSVEELDVLINDPTAIRIDFLDTSLIGKVWVPETQTWREALPSDLSDMKSTKISHGDQWLSDAIGVLANLSTTEKGSLIDAINECFQSVSDGKAAIGDAITDKDPSITIPENPTFAQLVAAIAAITTGLKVETGHIQDFTSPETISGETSFLPKIVIVFNFGSGATNFNLGVYMSTSIFGGTTHQVSERITGTPSGYTRYSSLAFTITNHGFTMKNVGAATDMYWAALG